MLENRWFVLTSLFIARFALGFQFQSAGSVATFLIRDFGVDYAQIGTLVGLYMLPGVVVAIPGGILGRRFGDKRIVLIGIVLMIIGGVLAGAAEKYSLVLTGRLLSGIGACVLFVLMTKMVADWFAGKELFLGMSIFIIGWPMGIAAAQATQGSLAEMRSWNAVFHLTAVLLVLAFATMAAFYRRPPTISLAAAEEATSLSRRDVWLVCIAGAIWMFLNAAYLVMLSFGPTLLIERGASVADAGFTVSLMSWVFIGALPLGAYLATRYQTPDFIMAGGLIVSILIGALIPVATAVAVITFALFGISFAMATPMIASLPAQSLAPQNRGPGLGIYYVWYYAGLPVLTPVGGLLKDRLGTAAFSVFFATAMMALCLGLLILLRYEQRRLTNA